MRISTWLHLAALCFLAGSVPVLCSQATAHAAPPGPKDVVIKEEFQGIGLTPKDAEAHALERACDWLAANTNLGWTPTPEFLREKGMVRFVGEPSEQAFEVAKGFAKDGKMKTVTMQLEITAGQAREIQKQAQHQRMKERQKLSLLVVLGMVCLLGVVGGYLRLEEATKGYYTRWLRLAAVGVLLVIVAGLCMVG
jgi:hypothetical protein